MKKKIFSLAVVIACIAALAASSTMAYFTAEDTAQNVVTTGKIDIQINEVTLEVDPATGEPVPFEDVTGVMPGEAVDKIVSVENINLAAPAFIRVYVEPTITLAEKYSDMQETVDTSLVTLRYNETDWTYYGGYWFYNHVLDTSAESEPLFTAVEFSKDMGNIYQGATVQIDIIAEAVQVKNNPGDTALTAHGWPDSEE